MNMSHNPHTDPGDIADAATANTGTVISVRGSVVDVRFDTQLPSIHTLLRAGNAADIVLEVLAQLDERHVRDFVDAHPGISAACR